MNKARAALARVPPAKAVRRCHVVPRGQYDGYRLIVIREDKRVGMFTKNGND
jgi:hypothetical protein